MLVIYVGVWSWRTFCYAIYVMFSYPKLSRSRTAALCSLSNLEHKTAATTVSTFRSNSQHLLFSLLFAMINPKERFFSEGQSYFGPREDPAAETHCNVWDWDQLRMVKVQGTAKLFPPEVDEEVNVLRPFADYLSLEIRAIIVDDDGLLTGVSTDPLDDNTMFIAYLPFSTVKSLANCRTVQYSRLQELDRLGPGVDLSSYKDESGHQQTVAFKFDPSSAKQRCLEMAWNEVNLLNVLPPHPNILPLDRIVLEDLESRIVGFTTPYIPGGTLENPNVPFRFEWLQQLTEVVDFLNLELGVMHQDIAPRNLLIHPDTGKLLLFDFNWAACGEKGLREGRDDVTGVAFTLYELITNDTHFTSIPHWERDMETLQSIPDWTRARDLDADVSTFRKFLNDWVATRKSNGDMEWYLNAPKRPTWPDLPTPPDYDVPFEHGTLANGEINWMRGPRTRRCAMELGQYCFRWERPPQSMSLKKIEKEEVVADT